MADFFVLGNPRSGTTLFRLALNSHPKIVVPPECGFALWLAEKFHMKTGAQQSRMAFVTDVLQTKKIETWGLTGEDIHGVISMSDPQSYSELCRCVYLAYARKRSKLPAIVGDKNNYYMDHSEQLGHVFPRAKKLFIIRDGRDVACSYLALSSISSDSPYRPKLHSDIREIATEWSRNAERLLSAVEAGAVFIRYEDLLRRPRETLTHVCGFLGVDYDEAMLNYQASNDEPEEFLKWKPRTVEQLDESRIGVYKRELTGRQLGAFCEVAAPWLVRMGYNVAS